MRLSKLKGQGFLGRTATSAAALAAFAFSAEAKAQRADQNAVTAAEDAFGTSIGRETIGLYSPGNVRGFSPKSAGNIRIDGLYFDEVADLPSQLLDTATIRVGLSAQSFPFPAPTGIVDYAVRKPGDEARGSAFASVDSYGSLAFEGDVTVPVAKETLSLWSGAGFYRDRLYNGTGGLSLSTAATLLWRPSPSLEIQPFWTRLEVFEDDNGPIYIPAGPSLPPRIRRGRFDGPEWLQYKGTASNVGGLVRSKLSPRLLLRAGVFRSAADNRQDFSNLYTDVTSAGLARQIVVADPPSLSRSTSGEVRLTWSHPDGPRLHALHMNVRGRSSDRRYDGSASLDLGLLRIGERRRIAQPAFAFAEQTRDRVRQVTAGIAYEGRWKGVAELGLGLQKTSYRKLIEQPQAPDEETRSAPWLFNGTAAVHVADGLALYAGYTRGLEESGVAPQNAVNRNEALPAIRTEQRDAGVRWTIRPDLRLVAGLFDVRKPYFNLNEAGRFEQLGDVKHQGAELSLTGALTPSLSLVAGAVLLRARVTGEGVRLGRLGELPVGRAARTLRLNLDWRPPGLEGVSLDFAIVHNSRMAATSDNRVFLPARTLVDLGGRYRFALAGQEANLRLSVTNLFNAYGFSLQGSGVYGLIAGRAASASLAVDF